MTGDLGAYGLPVPPAWTENALCAQTDPEMFFPEKGGSTREAIAVCSRCPVAAECFDYALNNRDRHGVWGGVSERTRHRLLTDLGINITDTDEEPDQEISA